INRNGVTIDRTKKQVSFTLTAPSKKTVYLLGDFNQYKALPAYAMSQTPDGTSWWITLSDLDFSKNHTYQFLVDGQLLVADPYAGLVLDPQYDPGMGFKPVGLPTYPQGARGIVA